MTSTPPGFGAPGQQPVFQGKPLASPTVPKGKFLAAAAGFVALAVVGAVGFYLTRPDVKSASARLRDRFGIEVPTFAASLEPHRASAAPSGPVPEPVTYRGTGKKTISVRKPERGVVVIYAKGRNANGVFTVSPVDAQGRMTGLAITSLQAYEGTALLDEVSAFGETTRLAVDATGPWTIELRSVRSVPSFGSSTSGSGPAVVRYTGPGGTATFRGGKEFGTFVVTGIVNGRPHPFVIGTGPTTERKALPAGPLLLEIESSARWSVRVA